MTLYVKKLVHNKHVGFLTFLKVLQFNILFTLT